MDRKRIFLGLLHVLIGVSIIVIWYILDLNLLELLTGLTTTLPAWTLAIAGFVEGIYWLGGIIPGLTYIVIYLLSQECSVIQSGTSIFLIWAGVASALVVSYVTGRLLRTKKIVVEEVAVPWNLQRFFGRMAWSIYPSAAATHIFEQGYMGRKLLPSFIPIIIGGLTVLTIYVVLMCAASDLVRQGTGEIGFIFGTILILWGLWRIWQGVRIRSV